MPYKNKEDQKKCAAKHYQAHKQDYIKRALAYNKITKVKLKMFITTYLKLHPCVDCGEDNHIVLEFDHVSVINVQI
jgi:hypothetical protein